jgi:small-conductance mechanosensitive channel
MLENIIKSDLWSVEYFNNTVFDYTLFAVILFVLLISFFVLKRFILRLIEEKVKEQKIISFLIESLDRVSIYFCFFISFYISSFTLEISEFLSKGLYLILLVWMSYYLVAVFGSQFIDMLSDIYTKKKLKNEDDPMIRFISRIAKALLWVGAALMIMSSLGINITALVAGMGVGGIAVAFALQQILGDLFSSFSIYFDKPFVAGDYVVVDGKGGVVEKIGIKSTRIRALQGEEMIFSNKDLTSKTVHNYGNMESRRDDVKIGVVYGTPSTKLKKIPEMVKKIIDKEENVDFDRAHFSSFGDFSLNFNIVYYVKSADYSIFMDIKQNILLEIKKEFDKKGIEFAYPTNTIYLSKEK